MNGPERPIVYQPFPIELTALTLNAQTINKAKNNVLIDGFVFA